MKVLSTQTIASIFDSQSSTKRVFHELHRHGAMAIKAINSFPEARKEIKSLTKNFQLYNWKYEHIVALLDIIGLTHDAVYYTDGAISQPALAVILQIMEPSHKGGMRFKRKAHTYLTYQLLQELNKYNKLKSPKTQMGIKYLNSGAYGVFNKGNLFPQVGTGQNELFSALLTEYAMREASISIEVQLIVISAILNSIPFTNLEYQKHFSKSIEAVATHHSGALPPAKLSASAYKVGSIFANYFDIANYRDGSQLAAYNKAFALEQNPELLRMFNSGKDDLLLIAAASLDNKFHEYVLKPKLMSSQIAIFHNTKRDSHLNKAAISAVNYEIIFAKARAVGAFFAEANNCHLDRTALIKRLLPLNFTDFDQHTIRKIEPRIISNLKNHANPLPSVDSTHILNQGYSSDIIASELVKRYGLVKVLAIAKELESKISSGDSLETKKLLMQQLLFCSTC